MTPEPWRKHRHDADQVPTVPVTVEAIMSAPSFALGVSDARARRNYHSDYDGWNTNSQWNYERGRMWGAMAPQSVQLKANSKIAPEAIAWFRKI